MQLPNVNIAIDSIKDAKTKALNTLVTDKAFQKPLQAFIDAEAQLAKATFNAVDEFFSKFKVTNA